MHIFVGSTNPVKLNAVTNASSAPLHSGSSPSPEIQRDDESDLRVYRPRQVWSDVIVTGFEVESGVSHQPLTDQETQKGAENRARNALRLGVEMLSRSKIPVASQEILGIGLEGGVFENDQKELWNTVWACVVDRSGKTVFSNGERFLLPEILAKKIKAGQEMGPAMDELIGSTNIKHQQGMIGVITKRFIERTELYTNLAKLALGLWYGRDWQRLV